VSLTATGTLATATLNPVNNAGGQLLINLPALGATVGAGTITVSGVKVNLAGSGKTSLSASIGVSPPQGAVGAYSIQAGQNQTVVISTVATSLANPTINTTVPGGAAANAASTAVVLSNGQIPDNGFSFNVPEGFVDAVQAVATLAGSGFLNDTSILLTFAGVPSGVTLTLFGGTVPVPLLIETPAAVSPAITTANFSSTSITSSALTSTFSLTPTLQTPSLVAISTFRFFGQVSVATSATLPLPAGNITVQATLTPNGTAFNSGAVIAPAAGNFPRFAVAQVPATPLTVVTIAGASTNLLMPYAVSLGASSFDTGVAIANTTADPFGSTGNGALAQNGSMTFNFYPQTGNSFSYTTSSNSPGTGLTSGVLNAGGTYVVLLSQLLTAANGPSTFTGYVFIQCNFTNGHGVGFVSDFKTFTSASNILVLPPPAAGNPRTGLVGEGLNH
jgi:hypothetical protein